MAVFVPRTIEINAAIVTPLNRCPFTDAVRQYRVLLAARRNHKQASRVLFDAGTIGRQLVNNRFILLLDRFQLFH